MYQLAIFASGEGSNARNIIEYFKEHKNINISLIVCNNPNAGVLNIAKEKHIPSITLSKDEFYRSAILQDKLEEHGINFIILAGFLWLIPKALLRQYKNKMVNIHPALLPKFGGKGMYGMNVHNAVLQAHEKETGITIHFVNENYDEGQVIFQIKCAIDVQMDSPETIKEKVQKLEQEYYPKTIAQLLT